MTCGAGFNGSTSVVTSTTGNDLTIGAYTMAALVYLSDTFGIIFGAFNGANNVLSMLNNSGTFHVGHASTAAEDTGATLGTSKWYLLVITKATGTAAPRAHTYDGTSWRHANMDASLTDPSGTIDRITIGAGWDGGWVNGLASQIAWCGLWNEDTTDENVELLSDFNSAVAKTNRSFFTGRSLAYGGIMRDVSGTGNHETARTDVVSGGSTIPSWIHNFAGVAQAGFQKNTGGGASTTATAVTLGAATTTGGSLLVAVAGFRVSGNFVDGNVTDNKGNSFPLVYKPTTSDGEPGIAVFLCSNFTGGSSHIVTVTNTALTGKCIAVVEYSGQVTGGETAFGADDTTSPHTSGTTATLSQALCIAVAMIGIDSQSDSTLTCDTDYIQIGESVTGSADMVCEMDYKVLHDTTAEDCGWTWSGTYAGTGAQSLITVFRDALWTAPPEGVGPEVIDTAGGALSTNDPAVTFGGTYTPLEDDIIIMFVSSTTVLDAVVDASLPAGWLNVVATGHENLSDVHGQCAFWHVVTAAEEAAVTRTYTITNALAASETGYCHAVAVRGADTTIPFGVSNIQITEGSATGNLTTPHVIMSVAGADIDTDYGLVLASVVKDGTGTYGAAPAGWTKLRESNTNQGVVTLKKNTLAMAGVATGQVDITPSGGDEYCSITVVVSKLPVTDLVGAYWGIQAA